MALPGALRRRLEKILRRAVPLVEGPIRDRVRASDRDLELSFSHGHQVRKLGIVEWRAERDRGDDGRLAVVLIVEGADAAAPFEAVRVADRPVVHLRALLLAVVDDVEAGALLQADRVEAGPTLELGLLFLAERRVTQEVQQALILRNLEPLAPATGFFEVLVVQWLAGIGLDPPAWLVQRSHLVGQQRPVIQQFTHTETSSFAVRAASPRRCTFCSATTVGR